jgi:hypothetical protein
MTLMRTLLFLGSTILVSSLTACSTHVNGASGGGGDGAGSTSVGDGGGPIGEGGGPIGTGGGSLGDGGAGAAGDGGSGGFVGSNGARPPAAGASQPGDGDGAVFAISKLFIGDTDRNGAPDKPNGWKNYGYNIDGQITSCQGNGCQAVHHHCKPAGGGSPAIAYPDGKNGIDNSFGENILPILEGVQSDEGKQLNARIAAGKWTVLFDVQALGAGNEYRPLTSLLYVGADLGHPAAFDGSDVWPVRPEGLSNPSDVTSSKEVFPMSYVIGNTWVSWYGGHLQIPLETATDGELALDIGAAVASFDMSPDHAEATNGTISGVLDTAQFILAIRRWVGEFDPSLCSGNTIDSIANQVRQASDIMNDGSPGTDAEQCNGISIGLGFNAARVQLGGVGAPTNSNDPCGP